MLRHTLLLSAALFLSACAPSAINAKDSAKDSGRPFTATEVGSFNEPWAMTFVNAKGDALITEKAGKLLYRHADGKIRDLGMIPGIAYGGQGGLGDVIAAPDYAKSGTIYLSWAEAGEGSSYGAVVAMANIRDIGSGLFIPILKDLKIIWKQSPKVSGRGHYGHRLTFSPDGKYLFISSGERQKFEPAQDMNANLGKIVRLNLDGSTPKDNPFYDAAKPVQSEIWSFGHRNPLGLSFDSKGQLWNSEMGPKGGDEVNLIKRGANYGYPKVSNGSHYDGKDIPDHKVGDGFEAPAAWWNPAISPGSLAYYNGKLFPAWKNSLFVGALGGKALIRLKLDGGKATKADEWPMDARIREVETHPDGSIWLLVDGEKGKLLKLTPKK